MPDFETRRPPGPKRPSRAHMFEGAFREAVYALGDRLNISKRSVDILLLALLAVNLTVILIVWAVETPLEQLDNEIRLKPTPAYDDATQDFSTNNDGDTGYSRLSEAVDYRYRVFTEPTSAVKMASITEELRAYGSSGAVSVEFSTASPDGIPGDSIGTSYCLNSKYEAVSTLGVALARAELLGKTDYCYMAVYTARGTDLAALP